MKNLFLTVLLSLFAFTSFAQLKVKSTGKVAVGQDRDGDDRDNEVTMSIFGPYGDYRGGSRLAFGDYGRQGNNVFIGEYTNGDTDKMWLHGKKGIYFTYGESAQNLLAYFDTSEGFKFTFRSAVYAQGIQLTSDERFKTDINQIGNSLTRLKKLTGVSYYYNFTKFYEAQSKLNNNLKATTASEITDLSEKEKNDIEFFKKFQEEQVINNSERKNGFIAQELKEVFPELVTEDSSGFLYVDYIGLIPVIVEALKEQQETIEDLRTEVYYLRNTASFTQKSHGAESSTFEPSKAFNETECKLEQNIPNPFSNSTTIKFYIPEKINSAYLCFFDMQGKQLNKIALHQRGHGSENISNSSLTPGLYFYALIADGKEIDVKRMLATE